MKPLKQTIALTLCFLMLASGAVFAFSQTDSFTCAECGAAVGHETYCSLYKEPDSDTNDTDSNNVDENTDEALSENTDEEPSENACTCGDEAPENIAFHDEACPRRLYVQALIKGRTAEAIYADWDGYDEALRNDILNFAEEHYFTTYDTLVRLLNAPDLGDFTDLNVQLGGIPSDIAMSAKAIERGYYNMEASELIGRHKCLFAIDITLFDSDNAVYQPDGSVTVTLDTSQLDMKGTSEVGILHVHDGELTDIGEYTVENDKLTFTTDGFSEFYGYLVDFEYDDSWYSIPGGSGIFLFELFERLGIDADVNDVTDITFSDNSLIEITKHLADDPAEIHEEWYLQSLKPFDTEEALTVTFAEHEPIIINVFDAISNYYTWENETHIRGDGEGADNVSNSHCIGSNSSRVTISGTVNIYVTGTLTLKCQFYIPTGATLNIYGYGENSKIVRDDNMVDDLFLVEGGTLNINPDTTSPSSTLGLDPDKIGTHIEMDGQYEFSITDDASSATKKNITVTKGNGFYNASVIVLRSGKVNINDTDFKNFYTTYQSGSGNSRASVILAWPDTDTLRTDDKYSELRMTDCNITNCATTSDMSVIMIADCKAELRNCEINNCYSGNATDLRYGGVIKGNGGYYGNLSMTDCKMSGNYSSGWGGAILWAASGNAGSNLSDGVIDNCTFDGNTAQYIGGAISIEADMTVKNSTFTNNKAVAGGAIGVFPFTRYDSEAIGITNACGLTMGSGNTIKNNQAVGTGSFKAHNKDYVSGGGGIWLYMNISGWTATLDIGAGNTISNNEAKNEGGAVFIDTTKNDTTTHLTIGDADGGSTISNNTAARGGGIAAINSKLTISGGQITGNNAKNGGGIYIADAGALAVTGGIIKGNRAQGSFSGNTALNAAEGVGGGIYIDSGSFSMSGTNVGLHSNKADVAANDAFARGTNTELNLPAGADMNIIGFMGGGKASGWYADYMPSDISYPSAVFTTGNPGRYDFYNNEHKLLVDDIVENAAYKALYYCLTLGTEHAGFGSITIEKTLTAPANEAQTFLFNIKGTDSYDMTVALVIKKGEQKASVTIAPVPDGTYTVTELEAWSWRYKRVKTTYKANDTAMTSGVKIEDGAEAWTVTFENKLNEPKWFSGDCYCENLWDGDSNNITKREENN